MRKRIDTLTSFRAFAVLSIFISHLHFLEQTSYGGIKQHLSYARLAVDFFFVLSGFVMGMGYDDKFNETLTKVKYWFFIKKRIVKLYPVYLVTILVCIPYYLCTRAETGLDLAELLSGFIFRLIFAIPMLQSLVPFGDFANAFNGVGWFLSCIFVLYLATPFILKLNNRIKHKSKTIFAFMLIDLAAFGFVYMVFWWLQYKKYVQYDLALVYATPYIRIFAYVLGILLYDAWKIRKKSLIDNYSSGFEAGAVMIYLIWWLLAGSAPVPTVVAECISILVSAILIYIFSCTNGFLTKD